MTHPAWGRVSALFDEALALDAAGRERLLERAAQADRPPDYDDDGAFADLDQIGGIMPNEVALADARDLDQAVRLVFVHVDSCIHLTHELGDSARAVRGAVHAAGVELHHAVGVVIAEHQPDPPQGVGRVAGSGYVGSARERMLATIVALVAGLAIAVALLTRAAVSRAAPEAATRLPSAALRNSPSACRHSLSPFF